MIKSAGKIANIKEVKKFALMMMWAIPLLFIVIFPWLFSSPVHFWSLLSSVILAGLYYFFPAGIYPFYRLWMGFATVMGWINTRVILAMVFYCMIMPIGILLRLLGKLQYQAKADENKNSFWINSSEKLDNDDMERPF